MIKYILIVLMLFTATATAQVQVNLGDSTQPTNIYKALKGDLTQLVSSLEGPAKKAYEMSKAANRTESIIWLIFSPVVLIISAGAYVLFNHLDRRGDYGIGIFISGFFLIASCLLALIAVPCAIHQLLNLEYYAIKDLINIVT